MASLKDMAAATVTRNLEVSPELTLDALYDKLSANAQAFTVPFKKKSGLGGARIVFDREPKLDVALTLTVKNGKLKLQPNVSQSKTTVGVGGMSFGIGNKNMMEKTMLQGEYIDGVVDMIKKIIG